MAGTLQVSIHHHRLRHITHGTEGDAPAVMTGYLEMTVNVGGHTDVMTLVLDTGKGYRLTRLRISDLTRYLLGR